LEIQAIQLSWVILSLLFINAPGSSGVTEFNWIEAQPGAAGVNCSGQLSFDAAAGKEKLRLHKRCQPGSRHPEVEDLLIRLDTHQIFEILPASKQYRQIDTPSSLPASFDQILNLKPSQALMAPKASLIRFEDGDGGWWLRMQEQPGSAFLPSALHYISPTHSLNIFFTGTLQKLPAQTFEIPAGYKRLP
jgi:hypothetical protein